MATGICQHCNIIGYCSKNHFEIHQAKSGDCFPFQIQFKQEVGKHCVATRNVKSFDLILEDTASALGTYDDSKPLCLSCLKEADITSKCEFCNLPMCESKQCMESSVHTAECHILRKHQPNKLEITGNHPVYALIAPLRIFQMKQSALNGDMESQEEFERIMGLASHLEELQKGY